MAWISYEAAPALGRLAWWKGQRYELAAIEGEGRSRQLRWLSACASCGQPFTFKTPLVCLRPNRRCKPHQRPRIVADLECQL